MEGQSKSEQTTPGLVNHCSDSEGWYLFPVTGLVFNSSCDITFFSQKYFRQSSILDNWGCYRVWQPGAEIKISQLLDLQNIKLNKLFLFVHWYKLENFSTNCSKLWVTLAILIVVVRYKATTSGKTPTLFLYPQDILLSLKNSYGCLPARLLTIWKQDH